MTILERANEIITSHSFTLDANIEGAELEKPGSVLSGEEELQKLISHITNYSMGRSDAWIVEIGTAFGGTAAMFAAYAALNQNLRVMTMAPHNRPEIAKMLRGMEEICWFYNMTSQKAIHEWKDNCAVRGLNSDIWFLFVDGNHTYKDVYAELDLYSPSVMLDGSIICHDADWCGEVKDAIRDWLRANPMWERVETKFSILALLKRK